MSSALFLAAETGPTLIAQVATVVVAFFVVVMILAKTAVGPFMKMIDERRETIAREFESIDSKQSGLESRIRDYEERLRQIDNAARERMNKAIDEGKRTAADVIEEGRKASEEMKAKAAADIRMEMEKSRVELRNEIVRLTISATEKLLRAELNDDRHKQLVGGFISELEHRQ